MKRKPTQWVLSVLLACIMLAQPFGIAYAEDAALAASSSQQRADTSTPESSLPASTDTTQTDDATSKTESGTSGANASSTAAGASSASSTAASDAKDDTSVAADSSVPQTKDASSPSGRNATEPAAPLAEPDITTDLVIDVTQLSLQTPTINGTYDTGGAPGDYIPGKDFSATDDVSTGKEVDYELGISLSSLSSTEYPIDKMYLEIIDAPFSNSISAYYLNDDPNPQNITDTGTNTLVPNYFLPFTSLVFDETAGITSTSTQKMPAVVSVPLSIIWKSKIMPQVRVVCERAGAVKKSEPFTLQTVRFSSTATLTSNLYENPTEWAAFTYETTPEGTGFRLPFRLDTTQSSPSNIRILGTGAQYDTLVYSIKIGAKLDGVAQALTSNNFTLENPNSPGYHIDSITYSGGILTVLVKPLSISPTQPFSSFFIKGTVFVPYTKGAATQVTVGLDASWNNAFSTNGVDYTNFVNQYLFSEVSTGSISLSRTVSLVPAPIPVFMLEDIQANYDPPNTTIHTLRITPNTFTNNTDMKFVRTANSQIAGLPKATGMSISLYNGPGFTFVSRQTIPANLYTFTYAYVPSTGSFNANTLSQQVLAGSIPMDTYENVVANTGHTPNIMLAVLSGDATQGLPITSETTQQYEINSPAIVPIPGSEFYTLYQANPSADYTAFVYSYIALATKYTSVAQANAAYGSQLASVDQFVQRGNTVYVDLGTTMSPTSFYVSRFGQVSKVRADIPVPKSESILLSSINTTASSAISDISDYSKEYLYKIGRRLLFPNGDANTLYKAGTKLTIPVDPAVAAQMYISSTPYLHVQIPGTFDFNDIPIPDYSYDGTSIKLTIPVDFVMDVSSVLLVPIRFITPYVTIPSATRTPVPSGDLYLSSYTPSVIDSFPNSTPYFTTTFQNSDFRLLGGSVDTTGLLVAPGVYTGGTSVTYTAKIANISYPTNDYYLSMTVPTNKYNPKQTSNNTKDGFITSATLYSPGTVLYYQTAANATAQDIAQMKSLNGAQNLQEFYNTRVVTGWTLFNSATPLPADTVMMVAYLPNVLKDTMARVDYNVRMDVSPTDTTLYTNDAVVTYYSQQADLESQSNMVTISNLAYGVVNVQYLLKGTTTQLAPDTQLTGAPGTPYTTTPKTISGYTLDSDSGNTTGTFKTTPQTVTYYYVPTQPAQGTVIVKYLEKGTNNPLAPQDTLTGNVGSPYTTTAKTISGYTLDSDSGNTTGTFKTTEQTVIYYYTLNPPQQGVVIVKYLEKGTNTPVAPQTALTGDVGSPYATSPIGIVGYTLDSDSGNTTGTFKTTEQTVIYYYVKCAPQTGTVLVQYLEKGTSKLLAPTDSLSGAIDSPYSTTPKTITGYTLDSDSGNTTGTFKANPQTVTYYYTQIPPAQGSVIVKYLEKGTNNPLAPQTTLTGNVGSPYATTPIGIVGYALHSDSGNTTGTYKATEQTVIYYYVKCAPQTGTVLVQYLEKGTNKVLAPTDSLTGAIDSPYTTSPKTITGYTLDSNSGNTTGTFKATPQTVTYYYTSNTPQQGTVVVKYLEKGTSKVLAPETTLTGNVGSPYGTVPKAIPGYALDSDSGNTTGTYKATEQTVTYYYVKCAPQTGTVMVQYLEKGTSKVLAPTDSLTGAIGSPYTTAPKGITGYGLDSNSGNTTGTFKATPQTVTYYYVKCQPALGTVLVKYLEKGTDTAVAPQDTLTGSIGSAYTTAPKTVTGYTLDSNSGNTTGTFKEAAQTVTYWYVKTAPPTKGTVTVRYLEKGTDKALAPADTLTGDVGTAYATSPKTIKGYTFSSDSGNTSGTFQQAAQTVTYYYTRSCPVPKTGDILLIVFLSLLVLSLLALVIVWLCKRRCAPPCDRRDDNDDV